MGRDCLPYGGPMSRATSSCSPVALMDEYKPFIVIPTNIRSLHPKWTTCHLYLFVTDPPIALSTADPFFPTPAISAMASTSGPRGIEIVPLRTDPVHHSKQTPHKIDSPHISNPIQTSRPNSISDLPPAITLAPFPYSISAHRTRNADALTTDPRTTIIKGGPAVSIGKAAIRLADSGVIIISDPSTSITLPYPAQPGGIVDITGHHFTADTFENLVQDWENPTTTSAAVGENIDKKTASSMTWQGKEVRREIEGGWWLGLWGCIMFLSVYL